MSLPRRMKERRRQDAELERVLRITRNDPMRERYGGRLYSPADIQALELERLPWLRRKRRQAT